MHIKLRLLLLDILLLITINHSIHAQVGKKYNVLFIMSDDLGTSMECYGNPLVKTPNLNRLAKKSVRFDRAYNQYPLCSPSRASMLTGYRPDVTGVYDLVKRFRENIPEAITLPQLFMRNGYFSSRVGKIFHYGVPSQIGTNGQDDSLSWDRRVNPIGRDKKEESAVTNHTPDRMLGSSLSFLIADGGDEEQTDGMIAMEAIKIMEEKKDEPFFLAVGFFRPHCPFIAPKKYFDLYPLEQVKLPPQRPGDWDDIPPVARWIPDNFGVEEVKCREALRAYYASLSFMDAQVGKLIDALERFKLADNTIIVFASDHGYLTGEHGQWMKLSLFEPSARTPLMIAVPGLTKGNSSPRTVELLDVYPTLSELCGLKAPDNLQGKSLLPLLKKPNDKWDRPAYTQVQRILHRGQPDQKTIMGRSVRTEKWRYNEWDEGKEGIELYDHENDPGEFTNLAKDPKYSSAVKEMSTLLKRSYQQGI